MLTAGRTMLTAVGNAERRTVVQVLTPALITNPNFPNQPPTLDWGNATVAATVNGILQPASAKALDRAGLTARVGTWELHTDATVLNPEGRVRIASQDYSILDARLFASHSEAVVEEVA